MAKYEVLRPIEHNGKLYLPKVDDALPTATSSSHGGEVPIDAGGFIELSEKEAALLDLGQIKPIEKKSEVRKQKSE